MNETNPPLEIERKFLIARPSETLLLAKCRERREIRQAYLTSGGHGENRRVREAVTNGTARYFYTEKQRITAVTRIEREREITREEFERLYAEREEGLRVIEKVRYVVPYEGHALEIDLFPFWADRAFCECELRSETETLTLPDWLHVRREVTDDPRYTNHALAREIPQDILS